MRDLAAEPRDPFLDAFTAALGGDAEVLAPWWAEPGQGAAGLSVYRNTIAKGCADTLVSLFPAVERVVGPDWLREAAILYAREAPPRSPVLIGYGEGFADWLGRFPPAAELPYLPGLARLDRLWTEAHLAADAEPLTADAFAGLTPEAFESSVARLHPSARLARFADGTPSLWRALRGAAAGPAELELSPEPEGIVILRPQGEVQSLVLSPGAAAFLQACADGASLATAAGLALAEQPDLNLSAAFAELIAGGAFSRLDPLPTMDPDR